MSSKGGGPLDEDALLSACRRDLPLYMVPGLIVARAHLPRNPNGKIDRPALAAELAGSFLEKAPQEKRAEGEEV